MSVSSVELPDAPPPWPVRRFTVAEYRQLCESGILQEDDRVELLDGWIVPKMTHNPPHDASVQLCQAALGSVLPKAWNLRIQSSISAGESEPEPDVAVVRGPVRRYADHHPVSEEIGLLIEVAETSLARDRAKISLYAEAGISQCWIINLISQQVETFSVPVPEARTYGETSIYLAGERVPLILDGQSIAMIAVDDLLP